MSNPRLLMNQESCKDSQEIHPHLGGLHILLFDPEKSTLDYTKSMLKQAFYTVISTGDQLLALKMLEENADLINLIIIEDKPQEMDCITFIKKIKATTESIPIVLLSNNEMYLSATLLQIGACRVVSKPIDNTEVTFLWKFANIWRKKAYFDRVENAVEDMEKQAMPIKSDTKGKGKLVPVVNGGSKHGLCKKRNHAKFERDFDGVASAGTGRKKIRNYTQDLHKKCLELAQRRNRISPKATNPAPANPFIPSTILLSMIKNNAGKNSIESNNIYGVKFPRLNTNDGSSKIQHSIIKPDFGFPAQKVLGMQSKSSYNFGEKRVNDNDLKRFSKLVDEHTSFLASNGEFMRQKQMEKLSQLNASPTADAAPDEGFIPSIGCSSWQNNIAQSTTKINEENDAFSLSQWVKSAMGEEDLDPACKGFDEALVDKFFEGVFDKQ